MKILSWNVNGIRAVIKKGFAEFLKKEKPDILCLQETKIAQKDIDKVKFSAQGGPASGWDFAGYREYWHPAERPGYSGTAVLIKSEKLKVKSEVKGIGEEKFDIEGRVQTMELDKFFLVNVYFPNANHELSRLDFKIKFNDRLLAYLKKLEKSKPVVICGDYNVAHEEIDLARPKDNVGNPGFTAEERAWMTKFLKAGFIDTFRHFYPQKQEYTWWSYRFFARAKNIGWRIDYFCVSVKMAKYVKDAFIYNKVMGSDHCPVGIEIKF
ncbi:MAG: exodeoxyribonuclease III [Planctomycetes bacterium]|jgi:exodeoxyribonuclease-3|nr:exodeoxyribonuclease III [Planctomycetota bacterium]